MVCKSGGRNASARLFSGLTGRLKVGSMALLVAAGLLLEAKACSFHNHKPSKTLVDWMLHGDTVVVARPDPDNPFSYKTTEVIRGDPGANTIPFLVDSVSRRTLARNQEDGVVFALTRGGNWQRIAYVGATNRQVIKNIRNRASSWATTEFHPDRFAFFALLQDHSNATIRRLALQEIDRVPYGLLRDINVRLSEEVLIGSLNNVREFNYRPINLLLLGLKGTDEARSYIRKQVTIQKTMDGSPNLGALATALVELEGVAGVKLLDHHFLSDTALSITKAESIVEAMAIHNGVGRTQVRNAIARSLGDLLPRNPALAPLIARQFSARQDWSLLTPMEALLKSAKTLNGATRLSASIYVTQAKAQQTKTH